MKCSPICNFLKDLKFKVIILNRFILVTNDIKFLHPCTHFQSSTNKIITVNPSYPGRRPNGSPSTIFLNNFFSIKTIGLKIF